MFKKIFILFVIVCGFKHVAVFAISSRSSSQDQAYKIQVEVVDKEAERRNKKEEERRLRIEELKSAVRMQRADRLYDLLLEAQGEDFFYQMARYTDSFGNTPIAIAVKKGHRGLFYFLISHQVPLYITNSYGETLLHLSVYAGDVAITRELLEMGLSVDVQDTYGYTPLYNATRRGNEKLVDLLLEYSASVDIKNANDRSILFAAVHKNLSFFKKIQGYGLDVHAKDRYGETLLHAAATTSSIDIISYLLEQGLSIQGTCMKGNTPLHKACQSGQLKSMMYLLSQGADVDAKNNDGITPLHNLLLADIDEAQQGFMIDLLLKLNVDINAVDNKGKTALHHIFHKELSTLYRKETITKFIKAGADVNIQDSRGYTLLHMAAEVMDEDMFEFLVESGCSLDLCSVDGKTAGDILDAKIKEHEEKLSQEFYAKVKIGTLYAGIITLCGGLSYYFNRR